MCIWRKEITSAALTLLQNLHLDSLVRGLPWHDFHVCSEGLRCTSSNSYSTPFCVDFLWRLAVFQVSKYSHLIKFTLLSLIVSDNRIAELKMSILLQRAKSSNQEKCVYNSQPLWIMNNTGVQCTLYTQKHGFVLLLTVRLLQLTDCCEDL